MSKGNWRTTTWRSRGAVASLLMATGLLAGAGPAAAHGGDASKVHGCFGSTNGKVEIVGANESCDSRETALDWPAVDTNTTYSAGLGLALSADNEFSVSDIPWSALTDVPDGLDDGDDVGGGGTVDWADIENNPLATNDGLPNEAGDPVSFTKLKDLTGRILGSYVANETLQSEDVQNGTLQSQDVANETLQTQDVADGTLQSQDVLNGTLQGPDLADGAITGSKLAGAYSGAVETTPGAVTSAKILDGSIEGRDLGNVVQRITTLVDPPSIPAGGRVAVTITGFFVADVKQGDLVTVSPPAILESGLLFTGSDVLNDGEVTVYLNNVTSGEINPAFRSWTIRRLATNG